MVLAISLIVFRSKFRGLWPLLKNITLTSENSEVRYTWLFTSKELIGCLLQELVEVKVI
jgi:hypothetical protein